MKPPSAIREAFVTWLADQLTGNLQFLTMTYKQRRIADGSNFKLDRYLMQNASRWFLIRLDRKILGRKARKGCKLERLVFHEGKNKNLHSHMVFALPKGVTKQEFDSAVAAIWKNSDWGRPKMDSQECYEYIRLLRYLTKEGPDSFDIGNSHFDVIDQKRISEKPGPS